MVYSVFHFHNAFFFFFNLNLWSCHGCIFSQYLKCCWDWMNRTHFSLSILWFLWKRLLPINTQRRQSQVLIKWEFYNFTNNSKIACTTFISINLQVLFFYPLMKSKVLMENLELQADYEVEWTWDKTLNLRGNWFIKPEIWGFALTR